MCLCVFFDSVINHVHTASQEMSCVVESVSFLMEHICTARKMERHEQILVPPSLLLVKLPSS